jgi:DNA-binding transcriptional LysR family regulator
MGPVDDPGLVARKLGDLTLGVFASPRYLAARGTPKKVDDLARHECIAFVMPRTGRVLPWLFADPSRVFDPEARYRCLVDPSAGIALAVAGEGLTQAYHFMVTRELASGALVEVLAPHAGRTRRFSLLYPRDVVMTRAVRAVADEIIALARDAR